MSIINKLVNVAAWILLCVVASGAAAKVYVDSIMHTHVHSILILIVIFALIFYALFQILSKLGIWTGGEGRE